MAIALAQVNRKFLPVVTMQFDFYISLGEDIFHDHGIGVAVRHYRSNIAVDTERLRNCLVERNVAVLRARERAVDVEQNEAIHEQADIRTIAIDRKSTRLNSSHS